MKSVRLMLAHSSIAAKYLKALIHAAAAHASHLNDHQSIWFSKYGMIFMGTPHQGGSGVHLGQLVINIASMFFHANDEIIKHLDRDSEWLQLQQVQYAPISANFKTKFAYETLPTRIGAGQSLMVSCQTKFFNKSFCSRVHARSYQRYRQSCLEL